MYLTYFINQIILEQVFYQMVYIYSLKNEATNNSLHVHIGTKRCNINDDSSMLWHRRLGHISIDRIKRLVKDGVFSTLDYTDLETCVECIKGKQTNKSKKNANRSSNIFEIIHIDICCPYMDMLGQNISSLSLMITHDICMCTYFITIMKHWMPSKYLKMKLRTNAGSKYK